ncbi:MAG: SPASM domain-containing protein [Dehalococcoidales bacterium]|nr:SPASM domain-containing protein [Dehalococcoidales bacterium]
MPARKPSWKCSRYNNVFHAEDRVLLFSAFSGCLLNLNEAQYSVISDNLAHIDEHGDFLNEELAGGLIGNGFVIAYDADVQKEAHENYLAEIDDPAKTYFCIAPTMKCNFSCSYCFEHNAEKPGEMSQAVRRKLVDLVSHNAEESWEIGVEWFGGEPLLSLNLIRELTEEFMNACEKHQASYHAVLSTNGWLLDREVIAELPGLGITAVNLPFDGKPETFAERKGISVRQAEGFYDRIFGLFPEITDKVERVMVRINVDEMNYPEAYYIVNRVRDLFLPAGKIDFHLGRLTGGENINACMPHDCISTSEFQSLDIEFTEYLVSEGLLVPGTAISPAAPCAAVRKHSYSVSPDGDVYKCPVDLGQKGLAVFNLCDERDLSASERAANYIDYSSFDPWNIETCKDCSLLPVCLGECPRRHLHETGFDCTTRQDIVQRLLFVSRHSK